MAPPARQTKSAECALITSAVFLSDMSKTSLDCLSLAPLAPWRKLKRYVIKLPIPN
jgi:hypothetical protein